MKWKIAILLTLILLFSSCFLVFAAETKHKLGYSSVDSGEIRWGGSTKYTTAWNHAVSTWNALGKVNIAPDTAWTIEDLTISDVNKPSETWTGLYTYYPLLADTIQFNTANMDASGRTTNHNKKTATHELGHALGIGDHYESSYSSIIMYGYSSDVTSLKQHDKDDYHSIHK